MITYDITNLAPEPSTPPLPPPGAEDRAQVDPHLSLDRGDADPPPFPRHPGETPRAYGAFLAYFQLGPTRTLQAVADKLGHPLQTIKNWSSTFSWNHRLQSFYSGLLQDEAAAQRQQAADWSQRLHQFRLQEWDASQKLLAAAQCFLESFGEEDLHRMTLAQVSRALKIASTLARLAAADDPSGNSAKPAQDSFQQQLLQAVHRVYGTPPVPAASPTNDTNTSSATGRDAVLSVPL